MKTLFTLLMVASIVMLGWVYETHPTALRNLCCVLTKDVLSFQKGGDSTGKDSSSPPDAASPPQVTEGKSTVETIKGQLEEFSDALKKPPETPGDPKAAMPPPEVAFVPPSSLPAHPDWIWTTSNGRVYRDVIVTKVEADCVTILHADGGGVVEIAQLPSDIQKQLNYNPSAGAAAALKRAKDEQANQDALAQERSQASQLAQQNAVATDANDANILAAKNAEEARLAAAGRALSAQRTIQFYEDDLKVVTAHTGVDRNGEMTGDSFYLNKYTEDKAAIASLEAQAQAPPAVVAAAPKAP